MDLAVDMLKVTQHFVGALQNKPKRYGYPLTPFGNLALIMQENKGERHSKLKKDNSCENVCDADESETKELVKPTGLCEDE